MGGEPKPSVAAVIPARIDSSRFPGKPLAQIAGQPMIARVVERVAGSHLISSIYVATDDDRIAAAAAAAGASVIQTSPDHKSGSDRVAEAVSRLKAEIIVNVQGDQPLIAGASLDRLVETFDDPERSVATLVAELTDEDWQRPDVVKAVVAADGRALYFSRAPVPFWQGQDGRRPASARKHIGVYAFRRAQLLAFASWGPSPLEQIEGLEQLRLLEHSVAIYTVTAAGDEDISVDRPEDVQRVEEILARAGT